MTYHIQKKNLRSQFEKISKEFPFEKKSVRRLITDPIDYSLGVIYADYFIPDIPLSIKNELNEEIRSMLEKADSVYIADDSGSLVEQFMEFEIDLEETIEFRYNGNFIRSVDSLLRNSTKESSTTNPFRLFTKIGRDETELPIKETENLLSYFERYNPYRSELIVKVPEFILNGNGKDFYGIQMEKGKGSVVKRIQSKLSRVQNHTEIKYGSNPKYQLYSTPNYLAQKIKNKMK